MGQHKTNPTAIAAKEGKLPPKEKKLSKREIDRMLYKRCQDLVYGRFVNTQRKISNDEFEYK